MGFWNIQYITRSRGEIADKMADLLSESELRMIRNTNPKAWKQFADIVLRVMEKVE